MQGHFCLEVRLVNKGTYIFIGPYLAQNSHTPAIVTGVRIAKLLICRMVMPSIKNGPHTNTKGANLPCQQQKQLAMSRVVNRQTQLFYIWIFICFLLCKNTNLRNTAETISHLKSAKVDGFC